MAKFRSRPRSKRDRTLPYTYEGWIDILGGQGIEPIYDHFFADTLCGLVEALDEAEIAPWEVRLFGLYRGEKAELDPELCSDPDGRWLKRPDLCRALEEHFEHTHQERYRGHVDQGHCLFEDRDRQGVGPIW